MGRKGKQCHTAGANSYKTRDMGQATESALPTQNETHKSGKTKDCRMVSVASQ